MADAAAQEWTPERSAAGNRSPWLIAGIVSLATFMEVLDVSIANVALDHIGGSLSASYDEATWVLTSYLIANAIAIPIAGWLSNIVGRKRFYMLSVALFTVSSLFCGVAPNLTFLIIARIFQGIGGGGLAPSEQSILTETFSPKQRGGAFALYGLTVIAAPILGPTLGGLITDNFNWHWVFLINIPVGAISLFLVHRFVVDPPKLEEERQARLKGGVKVDAPGIILLILWLGGMEFVLDRGQRDDWLQSGVIVSCIAVSAISAVALVIWEWNHKTPVFNVKILKNRSYAISIVIMMATGAVVFGSTQLIPQFLQQVLGYTASSAGEAMTLGGLATIVLMPIAGILVSKVQPKWLIMAGLGSIALGLLSFSRLTGDVSWWWLALSRMGLAFGLPFLFIPITTAAYTGIKPEDIPEASSQINLARNLGGSLAISLAQTLIAQRSQYHQSRLVETLSPSDPRYHSAMSTLTGALHAQGAAAAQAATGELYEIVGTQAAVLAYVDTFWVFGVGIAALVPLIIFMKRTTPGQAAG